MSIQCDVLDQQTLEEMIDGASLKGVLRLIQEIAYAKADHLRDIEDYQLAREWDQAGYRIGKLAEGMWI
jgi:hypothetical protein